MRDMRSVQFYIKICNKTMKTVVVFCSRQASWSFWTREAQIMRHSDTSEVKGKVCDLWRSITFEWKLVQTFLWTKNGINFSTWIFFVRLHLIESVYRLSVCDLWRTITFEWMLVRFFTMPSVGYTSASCIWDSIDEFQ